MGVDDSVELIRVIVRVNWCVNHPRHTNLFGGSARPSLRGRRLSNMANDQMLLRRKTHLMDVYNTIGISVAIHCIFTEIQSLTINVFLKWYYRYHY